MDGGVGGGLFSLSLRPSIFLLFIPSRLAAVFLALAVFTLQLICTLTHLGSHFPSLLSPSLFSYLFHPFLSPELHHPPTLLSSSVPWCSPTRPSPARVAIPLIDDGLKLRGPQSEERPLDAGSNLKGNSADRHRRVSRHDVAVITCGASRRGSRRKTFPLFR